MTIDPGQPMHRMQIAIELVETGADAIMSARPDMSRMHALNTAALVLNATFPPSAVLVAEQAVRRAADNAHDPVGALREYVDELRAGDTST